MKNYRWVMIFLIASLVSMLITWPLVSRLVAHLRWRVFCLQYRLLDLDIDLPPGGLSRGLDSLGRSKRPPGPGPPLGGRSDRGEETRHRGNPRGSSGWWLHQARLPGPSPPGKE